MSSKIAFNNKTIIGAYVGEKPCCTIEMGGKFIAHTFNPNVTKEDIKKEFIEIMGSMYTVIDVTFHNGTYFYNSIYGSVEANRGGEIVHFSFFCFQNFTVYHGAQFSETEYTYYWKYKTGTEEQARIILSTWYREYIGTQIRSERFLIISRRLIINWKGGKEFEFGLGSDKGPLVSVIFDGETTTFSILVK